MELLQRMHGNARLLVEADLQPVQGSRFAPTGFPNLGAAEYEVPSSSASGRKRMLLVESAQSMANRLEALSWDEGADDVVAMLRGVPYVKVDAGGIWTDSIREAHRLNSPYIIQGLRERLAELAGIDLNKTKKAKKDDSSTDDEAENEGSTGVDIQRLAKAVFYYDPNSVLHGIFLEKIVGLARLTRLLSGFIEASGVELVQSGGVKNDRVDPSGKGFGGNSASGFGNVPFTRSEYTAEGIRAAFSFDESLLESYGLPEPANRLLRALAVWKISCYLSDPRRLRTNCDLEVKGEIRITRPSGAALPPLSEIESELKSAISECAAVDGLFAKPAVTVVTFTASAKAIRKG